jgi:hypothetical protein
MYGNPDSMICQPGNQWNIQRRTNIYCNPSFSTTTSESSNGLFQRGNLPSLPTKTTSKDKPFPTFNSGPMTACGPVLRNFNFPNGLLARCSKNVCRLECTDKTKQPSQKTVKCFPAKKVFKPKAMTEVRGIIQFNCILTLF